MSIKKEDAALIFLEVFNKLVKKWDPFAWVV